MVIVRADYEGGLGNLKNKKYCHPGFKHNDMLTPDMLQELELKALEESNVDICGSDGSMVEKHVKAVSDFFGESCRPGKWTTDEELDKYLSKYILPTQNQGCKNKTIILENKLVITLHKFIIQKYFK